MIPGGTTSAKARGVRKHGEATYQKLRHVFPLYVNGSCYSNFQISITLGIAQILYEKQSFQDKQRHLLSVAQEMLSQ